MFEIDGDIFYFEEGLLHRDNGPSIEFKSGVQWWFQQGKLHRIDGPAILDKKHKEYWINGNRASDEETKNIKRNYWIKKMTYGNK